MKPTCKLIPCRERDRALRRIRRAIDKLQESLMGLPPTQLLKPPQADECEQKAVVACDRLGMVLANIRSRIGNHTEDRRLLINVLRKHGFSYPAIGWVLKRDHSTIMHAAKKGER